MENDPVHTPCFRCKKPSVLYQRYSGRHLCAEHLVQDILVRVKRSVRIQGGIGKKLVLLISGEGLMVPVLLSIMREILGSRPGMEMVLLGVSSLDDWYSPTLSGSGSSIRFRAIPSEPGTFVDIANQLGADRIFMSNTLEDEGAAVLRSLLSGRCSFFNEKSNTDSLRYVKPLREIPVSELMVYATTRGIPHIDPIVSSSGEISDLLGSLTNNHPSIPYSLLNYAEKIQDLYQKAR